MQEEELANSRAQQQQARDREAFKIYLESFRFPVHLQLAEEVLLFMQRRDLALQLLTQRDAQLTLPALQQFLASGTSHLDMLRVLDKAEREPELHRLY